jgi:hypothetical protein
LFANISKKLKVNNIFTLKQMHDLILEVVDYCTILFAENMFDISNKLEKSYNKVISLNQYHEFSFESTVKR